MTSHRLFKFLWLPEVALLLACFGTRLFRLADMPPHIDEVFHVYRARDVWALHPLYFINTTKLLNVWLTALFYPFASPYWVARIVSVLSGLLTLACVYKLGKLLHNRAAGLLTGYLYLVLPLTFWHDRLAISDTVATATGVLVVLGGVLLAQRSTWRYAFLLGLALAAAYLSKVTMVLLWPAPLLAWLLLRPRPRLERRKLSRLGGAYAFGLALAAPIILYAYLFSDLGAHQVENRTQFDLSIPARLWQNASQLWTNVRAYVGIVVLLWLLAALVIGIAARRRRALFLLGAALLPVVALLAVGTRNDTRYYLIGLPPLLTLMGLAAALAWRWLRRALPDGPPRGVATLVGGLLPLGLAAAYAPFFRGAYADVVGLALPPSDYATYVSSYSAGFGWDAASERLRQMAGESQRGVEVVAPVEGHAWRTQIALTGVPGVEVFHPEPLTAEWLAGRLAGDADVYLVREEPRPAIDWASLGVTAELVGTFPKPGGKNWVELHRLTPAGSEVGS